MLELWLGVGNVGKFCQYLKSIWGYALGKYIYTLLRGFLPASKALVLTFGISGAIQDLADASSKAPLSSCSRHCFYADEPRSGGGPGPGAGLYRAMFPERAGDQFGPMFWAASGNNPTIGRSYRLEALLTANLFS